MFIRALRSEQRLLSGALPTAHTVSRTLSLVALGRIVWATWSIAAGLALLKAAVPMILIWFPYFVDDVTYGTWARGYRIDSHTPAILIVAIGWVLLGRG